MQTHDPSTTPRTIDDHGLTADIGVASGRRPAFQPGLEGLRGVAVVAVLFFHAGFPWASGGFLGVSTFFTLSGYLITSLLLHEHAKRGWISLRTFWGRRFRRLMPASLVCLAGIVLFGATVADASQLATLRGDIIAALLYVANLHFIVDGQGYTNLFSSPSPVLHFWSLAIEEQFYLVFPLVVAGLLAVGRGSRLVLASALTALTIGSVALSVLLYDQADPSRVYYGTDTRSAELLLGALLALLVASPRWRRHAHGARAQRLLAVAGLVAGAVVVWLYHRASDTDPWLYQGGFAAFALLSATVVVAATVPGPLRHVLALRPIRWIGAISYGVYLFHWPIFLWLTPQRTGLSPWPLFGLRIAVTFALAVLSYRLIEGPIRHGLRLRGWRPWVAAPAGMVLVTVGAIWVTATPPNDGQTDYDVAIGELAPTAETVAPVTAPPRRVMIYGDSVALSLLPGLQQQAGLRGDLTLINTAWAGCGTGAGGEVKVLQFDDLPSDAGCDARLGNLPSLLAQHRPDEVVVLACLYDVAARRIPGDDRYRVIGDPVFDAWLSDAMRATMTALSADGARVTWLTCPPVDPADLENRATGQPERRFEERDPVRIDRLNEMIRSVAATEPNVRVVEFGAELERFPGGSFDPSLRSDGVHLHEGGSKLVAPWLADRIHDPDTRPPSNGTASAP